jgi:hypothetical protein
MWHEWERWAMYEVFWWRKKDRNLFRDSAEDWRRIIKLILKKLKEMT